MISVCLLSNSGVVLTIARAGSRPCGPATGFVQCHMNRTHIRRQHASDQFRARTTNELRHRRGPRVTPTLASGSQPSFAAYAKCRGSRRARTGCARWRNSRLLRARRRDAATGDSSLTCLGCHQGVLGGASHIRTAHPTRGTVVTRIFRGSCLYPRRSRGGGIVGSSRRPRRSFPRRRSRGSCRRARHCGGWQRA